MTKDNIMRLFRETAYVRTGGSAAELKAAEYIAAECEKLGVGAKIVPFEVDMAKIKRAELSVNGKKIPCKGYFLCGSGEVEAEICYIPNTDGFSLAECRGKIAMIDGYLGYWVYHDILENGAVGFITYDGDANYVDRDIDQRELRSYVSEGKKILGVNINVKDAIEIINNGGGAAKITVEQDEFKGESRNVVAEIKGTTDRVIVFTAHYDSTSLSQGAYDNMSGSVGILAALEHFAKANPRHTLRFIWCGSEERGLLGSKAYTASLSEEELSRIDLNINLDMIGSAMGKFIACCTSEDKLAHYIEYMGKEVGFGISASCGVYSSDSTPFADKGVPSLSFARLAPHNTATIHNSYDTLDVISAEQMIKDISFINAFAERMANAGVCPVSREMPDEMKKKLDYYLFREREKK